MFDWLRRKRGLGDFDSAISRERLIQSGRIVVIDDEEPLLIEEMRKQGFSLDHDRSASDLHKYDNQIFDLAIVDYAGVGQSLGKNQGLDVLRYIRRVSPRTRVIAYTSRSLSAGESEFFRLSHTVLAKDLGLNDSLVLIEGELRKALSKEHLLEALIAKLNLSHAAERQKIQEGLVKALSKNNEGMFKEVISKAVGKGAEKTVEIIISKLFV